MNNFQIDNSILSSSADDEELIFKNNEDPSFNEIIGHIEDLLLGTELCQKIVYK